VSPVVVLVAGLGAAGLHAAGRRIEGIALVAVLGLGVLLSNALAYHDVSLAPHDRMAELERIGSELADRGPTLSPEFEEFAKHFLREGQPTGPSEAWTSTGGPVPPRPGGTVRFAFGVDLDSLPLDYVQNYGTIVLRRGFMSSRPPAGWRRTSVGDFYELWERRDAEVVEHLPLGQPRQPSDEPRCREIRALARGARAAAAHAVDGARGAPAPAGLGRGRHGPGDATAGRSGSGQRPPPRAGRWKLRPLGRGQLRPRHRRVRRRTSGRRGA
jgi:hypothetical protein